MISCYKKTIAQVSDTTKDTQRTDVRPQKIDLTGARQKHA